MKWRSARINEVVFDENAPRPTIVTFQNGELAPGRESTLKCSVLEGPKNERVYAACTDEMLYAGTASKDGGVYNNFLMTVDKETSECKLIAVDEVLLKAVTQAEMNTKPAGQKRSATTTDLNKQFGSKRTKRRTEQLERFKVNVETIKQDLEETAGGVEVDEGDLVPKVTNENNSEYRPSINRGASSLAEVYLLGNLVSVPLLATLQEKVEEVLGDPDNMRVCEFVKKQILRVSQTPGGDRDRKCQLLLYVDCLVAMLKTPAKTIGTSKYFPCDYSKKVGAYLLDNFTAVSAHGRTRSLAMRDKCICYILVLVLLACDYTLNLEELAKELKYNVKKLSEMARILALTQDKVKKNTFVLQLPLPAPVSGQKPSRKSR